MFFIKESLVNIVRFFKHKLGILSCSFDFEFSHQGTIQSIVLVNIRMDFNNITAKSFAHPTFLYCDYFLSFVWFYVCLSECKILKVQFETF